MGRLGVVGSSFRLAPDVDIVRIWEKRDWIGNDGETWASALAFNGTAVLGWFHIPYWVYWMRKSFHWEEVIIFSGQQSENLGSCVQCGFRFFVWPRATGFVWRSALFTVLCVRTEEKHLVRMHGFLRITCRCDCLFPTQPGESGPQK